MSALAPGIHDLPARHYHADRVADTPSLSASIARRLVTQSPKHAWTHHPRLNPDYEPEESTKFDIGTAAHRLLLEGHERGLVIIDEDSYRTKDAANARDIAYESGQTPLLAKQYEQVKQMVAAAREQIAAHDALPALLANGKPEQTLVWTEPNGVVCRACVDWLHDDYCVIDDLKTTSRSAHPDAYSRALFGLGGDIQAAFYIRGVHRLTGTVPEWRWIVVETTPPYALSVIAPTPGILELGHHKVERAIRLWEECLRRGEWPAYPTRVAYAELPPWEETRWLERHPEDIEGVAA